MTLSINNPPEGAKKKYPGANGYFVDSLGWVWEVRRISRLYMRWDYDGGDPGGSFTDQDGTFVNLSGVAT